MNRLLDACRLEVLMGGETRVLTGFLISETENEIVFAGFSDFSPAGVVFINRSEAKASKLERDSVIEFFEKVLVSTGRMPETSELSHYIDCTMSSALSIAMNSKRTIIVEGRGRDEYEVGRITAISDSQAIVKLLQPDGEWDDGGTRLKIKNIAALTILAPYCTVLDDYFSKSVGDSKLKSL